MDLDSFVQHQTFSRDGGQFLRWRKQGVVEVWLALRTGKQTFEALWQHGLPLVRSFKDRDTKEDRWVLWSSNWNCHEHESVNLARTKRDDEDRRKEPPVVCPICLMLEWMRDQIRAGKMALETPVFRFHLPEGYVASEGETTTKTLYAGGMTGQINDDLPGSVKERLKKARVNLADIWTQKAVSNCSYVLRVVDNAAPGTGIQIAIEKSLLGDKFKDAISARRARLGMEDGNPIRNPCAWRWNAYPKAKEIQKKYGCIELALDGKEARPLTEEIRAAIGGEPPDITRIIAPGNPTSLRAQLEQFALIDVPWDMLFEKAEEAHAKRQAEDPAADFPYGENVAVDEDSTEAVGSAGTATREDAEAAPSGSAPRALAQPSAAVDQSKSAGKSRRRVAEQPAADPPGDPCEKCNAPMTVSQTQCSNCGQKYAIEPDEPVAAAGAVVDPDGDKIPWAQGV